MVEPGLEPCLLEQATPWGVLAYAALDNHGIFKGDVTTWVIFWYVTVRLACPQCQTEYGHFCMLVSLVSPQVL
jgi:hypothetical protein